MGFMNQIKVLLRCITPEARGEESLLLFCFAVLASMYLDQTMLSFQRNTVIIAPCLPLCFLLICRDLCDDTALLRYPGQSPHVTITIWSNLNSLWPSLVTLVITFLTTGCYLINNFLLWCLDMKTFPHTGCVHIAESEKKIWINIF